MKISTRGRYALSFMVDLALHNNGNYIALKDISARQKISIKYLEQITSLLSKFGLLLSVRGPQGGYKLSRTADRYTIGEILRITEGDLSPVSYLTESNDIGDKLDFSPTHKLWQGLDKVVNDYLNGITLQDIVDEHNSLVGYDYSI